MGDKVFSLTKTEKQFLSASMNKVSRSFALVTPCFEPPLNDFMSSAYLICRVADNIEDCGRDLIWKRQRFSDFKHLLKSPESAERILSDWEKEEWPGLTKDEKKMMTVEGGLPLWQIFSQIPSESQSIIGQWSSIMADGMEKTEDINYQPSFISHNDFKVLATKSDYDLYCYYVAGTVGHMMTDLVISHYGFSKKTANLLNDLCEACGRGLQKTNIVKDFKNDLKRGFCYLPYEWLRETMFSPLSLDGAPTNWKHNIIEDVLRELRDFTSYIMALPYEAVGYRIASLMCVLPAYQTMLNAARNHEKIFTDEHQIKISKMAFLGCINDSNSMKSNNEAIFSYSQNIERQIDEAFAIIRNPQAVHKIERQDAIISN